jgi:TrmH family RNA methyltransferase
MEEMSDTVTPQGILAVLAIPDLSPLPRPTSGRLILVPDQVRDPGNLGTMLRTAWAAGVTQVLLPPGTVDPSNPKVVRAGMGAHFHLPVHKVGWDEIWRRVGDAEVWLAEAGRGIPYDRVDWRRDVALVIGGEASGAGQRARHAALYVQIPMTSGVESINAAAASAVILFEAARQRNLGVT